MKYREAISLLHRYSQAISRKLQTTSFDLIGKRLKTHTDFVFDPTKAPLFDSRGVLNLNELELASIGNDSLEETIDWYKNAY